jgi:small subunit ribosomal protein S3e
MIHSGQPARDFVDEAVRHVLLRQGVLGIKVKIMKAWDPEGRLGPKKPMPDAVMILEPKEEAAVTISSENKGVPAQAPAAAAEAPAQVEVGGETYTPAFPSDEQAPVQA